VYDGREKVGIKMESFVIQTENLSKVYQSRKQSVCALDKLNLTVQRGEVFGYLGPNGAGKTTTIRILLDLIRPTEGRALLFGENANKSSPALRQRIGFLPGELSLWKNLTGLQVIQYAGRVRGHLDMAYVNQLSERLKFDPSKKVRDYSSGNKRKLGLVLAFMHKPELVILDEPTSGLDPLIQQTFNDFLRHYSAEGNTVFMSSHVLSEVQAVCDRVGILRDGRLKAVERVETLTHADFRWVTVRFRDAVPPELLARVPGISQVTPLEHGYRFRMVGEWQALLHAIRDCYVLDIQTEKPSLEEIFLAYYNDVGDSEMAEAAEVKEGEA